MVPRDAAKVTVETKPSRRWLLALLVLCAAGFLLRCQHIDASLPYPSVNDELHIAPPALRVLKTGDYHPGKLKYPALPMYIAAAAMAVGFVQAAANEEVQSVGHIASVSFPYYSHPRVMRAARLTYALLSVLAVAVAGWMAWLLVVPSTAELRPWRLRPTAVVLTAPFVLLASDYYFMMSWRYLNVDIVATAFVAAGIVALLFATKIRYSPLRLAIVPAACAGLAAASKYTHVLLLVPVVVAIALFAPAGRRLSATALAVLTAGFVFVVANPFSVLDLPVFLNDLAVEARHYASGHLGHDPDMGLRKLVFYARAVAADFGIPALIAAGVGLGAAMWLDWRRTAIVASYALALLGLLLSQRVEFARNILPLFPLLAVFVAVGIHFAFDRLCAVAAPQLARYLPNRSRHLDKLLGVAAFALIGLLVVYVPLTKLDNQLTPVENSRSEAVSWIVANLSTDTALIVPSELGLDVEPLTDQGFPVQVVDFAPLDTGEAIDAVVADISPVAVLLTRWYADARFPNTELAPRLNAAAEQASLTPIASFGGSGVKVNVRPILIGNLTPRVTVAVPLR